MLNTKDWFTNQFETDKNILVADADWLQKLYGVETGAAFSLRLISDCINDIHQPVLVVRHDNPTILSDLGCHEVLTKLRDELKGISPNIPIVVVPATPCKLADARFGYYWGQRGTLVKDAPSLAKLLSREHAGLVIDAGATKKINSETRDAFQLFTRTYLTKDRTIQDFDMLRKVEGTYQPIELKRFYVAVEEWKPFCNDSNNFKAMNLIANKMNLADPICIGYSRRGGGRVTVHRIKYASYGRIEGLRAEVDVAQVWQARPDREYVSTNRMQ